MDRWTTPCLFVMKKLAGDATTEQHATSTRGLDSPGHAGPSPRQDGSSERYNGTSKSNPIIFLIDSAITGVLKVRAVTYGEITTQACSQTLNS
jgi:hypothetical protein